MGFVKKRSSMFELNSAPTHNGLDKSRKSMLPLFSHKTDESTLSQVERDAKIEREKTFGNLLKTFGEKRNEVSDKEAADPVRESRVKVTKKDVKGNSNFNKIRAMFSHKSEDSSTDSKKTQSTASAIAGKLLTSSKHALSSIGKGLNKMKEKVKHRENSDEDSLNSQSLSERPPESPSRSFSGRTAALASQLKQNLPIFSQPMEDKVIAKKCKEVPEKMDSTPEIAEELVHVTLDRPVVPKGSRKNSQSVTQNFQKVAKDSFIDDLIANDVVVLEQENTHGRGLTHHELDRPVLKRGSRRTNSSSMKRSFRDSRDIMEVDLMAILSDSQEKKVSPEECDSDLEFSSMHSQREITSKMLSKNDSISSGEFIDIASSSALVGAESCSIKEEPISM